MSSFVLGFAEESVQVAGLAWSVAGHSGALVAVEGTLSDPGAASIEGDKVVAQATVGGRDVAVDASIGERGELKTPPEISGVAKAGTGAAEVRIARGKTVSAPASLTTWTEGPAAGSILVRHLSVPHGGDGAIVLVAARPEGADHHHAEAVAAWKLDGSEGPTPFAEALISTQYDQDGLPTRVGLELWPDDPDSPATRAAGSRPLTATHDGVTACLMHTSAEGTRGVGGYLIVRP